MVEEAGLCWGVWAEDRRGALPELVGREWAALRERADVPLEDQGPHATHGPAGVLSLRLCAGPRYRDGLAQDARPSPRHRPSLGVRDATAVAVAARGQRLGS
jgi:hypothetical protein